LEVEMRALHFVVLAAVAACGSQAAEGPAKEGPVTPRTAEAPPGCEDSIRKSARNVPQLADPGPMSEAVAACIKEQWSAEMRRCVAAAKDRPDLVACMMRHEEQSGARTLRVDGIEPDRGDINGDTYVIIKGNRFVADGPRAAKVYFGSRQGTVVRFASDKQLIVRTPGGRVGEVVDVLIVFEPGGELRLPRAFTFVEKTSNPVDLE
jgi:hypothetical protein